MQKLPPFNDYLEHFFQKKRQLNVLKEINKELPHGLLRKELFNRYDPSNIDADYLMNEMGLILASTIVAELKDNIKDTYNNPFILHSVCCWK